GIDHEPMICYNGAYIVHQGKALASTEMSIETVQSIYNLADRLSIKLGLYHKDEWYSEEKTERIQKEILHTKTTPVIRNTRATLKDWKQRKIGAHKIMLMGTKESTDLMFDALRSKFAYAVQQYRSNDTLIEISPKTVSKLSAISYVLAKDETLEDVIAFGDNYNDIEMLKNVGCGVAVANARDEVKAIANHIALKNVDDGVAHFIKQHILI
ncbi:MAG: HAD-IIB family hydrolase, partial [Flavobacteriaceae bacterium]